MRVLIVKLGSIGDIVHTLPSLAAIRSRHPDATIGWVAEKRSAEILRDNPLIDWLIEIDTTRIRKRSSADAILGELRAQVGELRRFRFDTAIDFQGLIKSALVAKLSGARQRWGFAGRERREKASRVFLTDTIGISAGTHVIRKNLALADAAVGIADDEQFRFPISTGSNDISEADEITSRVHGEFALLNPGGGWPTKLWPAKNYGELADRLWDELGLSSICVTGPNESRLADEAFKASRSGKLISAQPGLKGFFELARRASVYVGGDTGPTHLAIAAGTPVVGIFGPTEWWRNGSINQDDICVERTDIGCRVDCHRRSCSNWICMQIGVERVVQAVHSRLGQPLSNLVRSNLNGHQVR